MKHIVLFSGGAASSYVAWLVAQEQKREDVILLHTPTYAEHPDADRFRKQVSEYIGIPITESAEGRSMWEMIDDYKALPSQFMPFCTQRLKQAQSEKFYKTLKDDFVLYLGYGPDEWRRVQKQTARFATIGRKAIYPLFERKITNDEVKRIIKEEWKICLPEPYKYLKHNNCLPCFKGGKSHFYKVWKYYPSEYWKAVEMENKLGHTVFKDKSLTELAEEWEHNLKFEESQLSMLDQDDNIPCMCAL